MMPAAKHGDPQMGVDIHLCVVPPSPSPVPLPTPHMSIVFDPFDYVPVLGATVTVCGMKRAVAGTAAKVVHIPPGFPFAPKIPDTEDELFMGSATVVADGDPFSFLAVPVLSCQVAGMISPPRPKRKGKRLMLLPTTVNMAIPTNVFVGGPPTISLMGMAFKLGFSALGKLAKSRAARALGKRFRDWRKAKFGHLNPSFLKCTILRAEPVNIVTGAVTVEQEDFTLPGLIPVRWTRRYSSDNPRRGACGVGWECPVDARLEHDADSGVVLFHHPEGHIAIFSSLPEAAGDSGAVLELMDGALLSDHQTEFRVRTKEDRIYWFPKRLAFDAGAGGYEYPLSQIYDLRGNALTWERAANGRPLALVETAGRRIELDAGPDGLIRRVSVTVPESGFHHVCVEYEFDAIGNLTVVRDALGNPYQFSYEQHRMLRHTDRNGLSFYYEYEVGREGWRVVRSWGDGGLYAYQFSYLDEVNEREVTDSLGHSSILKLDERGLPISEIDKLGAITIYEYDDVGRTTAVVDPGGHRTEYWYDHLGNLIKLIQADKTDLLFRYDAESRLEEITDPNGGKWVQRWDGRGLLTERVSPLGNVWRFEYNSRGLPIRSINPRGASTRIDYDAIGSPRLLTNALGHRFQFEYDLLGNLLVQSDPSGRTSYSYDVKGRIVHALLQSGSIVQLCYDAEDNLTRFRDENGAETALEYCGLGEIARRIQPDGHTVAYTYDSEERLVGVRNQCGELYRLKRDALGRIIEEVDYWNQVRSYSYDASGRLSECVDPLSRWIRYDTSPTGRVLRRHTFDGQAEQFEYDRGGNLTLCENEHTRVERRFDAEGRMLEERQGSGFIVRNGYDPTGNRISREIEFLDAQLRRKVDFRFDLLDQSIGISVNGALSVELKRDDEGQILHEDLGPFLRREISRNQFAHVAGRRLRYDLNTVSDLSYRYDCVGNLLLREDRETGTDVFTYDAMGLIVEHTNPQGYLRRYAADATGSELQASALEGGGAPGVALGITTAPATQIVAGQSFAGDTTSLPWLRKGEADGTSYYFDRGGSLVRRLSGETELQFCWDAYQRLQISKSNDVTTSYIYDPLGRRIGKRTGDEHRTFVWDGDVIAGEQVQVSEAGLAPAVRHWLHYTGTFEPLALEIFDSKSEPDTYFYENDPNGLPVKIFSAGGQLVWAAQFGHWATIDYLRVNRIDNPIRCQGQYYDPETGLSYTQFRYFDHSLGAFVSIDPIGLAGGENLYWAGPNMWRWLDPFGLSCVVKRRKTAIDMLKERLGIPHSQQPVRGWTIHDPTRVKGPGIRHPDPRHQGKVLEFEIDEGLRGKRYAYIIDHNHDPFHGGIGHGHTGAPKPGAARLNPGDRYGETGDWIAYEAR